MSEGWIKVHRSILNDELYLAEKFTKLQAWLDLLLLAEYKPRTLYVRSIKVEIGRGQMAVSIRDLATRWRWGVNKVQTFLKMLEGSEKIEVLKSNTINIIAICKYDKYQMVGDTQTDTQADTQTNTQNQDKTDTQKKPRNKGGASGKRDCVDTQTDMQTDTQTDTQIGAESDTQGKKKVTKEKDIEENKEVILGEDASANAPATPSQKSKPKTKEEILAATEERRQKFYNSLIPYVKTYGRQMVREFYNYWSELNKSGTKMKWELCQTWELERRLATWERKDSQFNMNNNGTTGQNHTQAAGTSVLANQRAAIIDDIAKADELYYKGK